MDIVFSFLLIGLMLVVIGYDLRHYIIPNWLNALVLAIYPFWYFLAPVTPDILLALGMFVGLFAVGFLMFSLKWLGGGDVKLLAVLGLYTGLTDQGVALLIYMALMGGLLSVVVVLLRVMLTHKYKETKPRIFRHKEPIPYGLAIASAFIVLVFRGSLPGFAEVNLLGLL